MHLRRRLLVLLLVLLALFFLFNFQFTPLLEALASTDATQTIEQLLSAAIHQEMEKNPTLYSDIVTLAYKNNGSVAALRADTAKLLTLRTRLSLSVVSLLQNDNRMIAEVPLSSLLGINIMPPDIAIRLPIRLTRAFNAYFLSRFEERGINQTRHSILFFVSIEVTLLIPGGTRTLCVSREFPFAETVIVGDVPDAYTHIDRLTDDITESEIDDIYDFGAEIP